MNPSPTSPPRASRAAQSGMSLIEILISVLILGIGVLGIAAMQAAALRNSQSSMQRSQAVIAANTMMDALRANATAANAGSYNLAMAAAPCTPPSAGATLIAHEQNWWITNMQSSIGPGACGSIACDTTTKVCTVVVTWNETVDATGGVTIASRL